MRHYLVTITTTSQGTEDRKITPYDDLDTAIRKFHEAFNTVGAGPKKVMAYLFNSDGFFEMQEIWEQQETNSESTES